MKIKIKKLPSSNKLSYGGSTNKLGGDFTNNVTFINEGGTHEQNPFEGVPFGVDNEGTPNLVEEGEVIWNDYVFSNRLTPTKKMLESMGFPEKYKDYSFALIAEELQKESAERPNDLISQRGLQDSMQRLIGLQEEVRNKRKDVQEKKAQKALENAYAEGGNVNILEGTNTEQTATGLSTKVQKALYDLYNARLGFTYDKLGPSYNNGDDEENPLKVNYVEKALARKENEDKGYTWDGKTGIDFIPENVGGVDDPAHKAVVAYKLGLPKEKIPKEKTFDWGALGNGMMRMAPLIANATDLIRNLKKPDYTEGDRVLQAANNAPVSDIKPEVEDVNIRPIDRNYLLNQQLNQGNTMINQIGNQAINAQQAMANMMLANAQTQGAIGDSLMKMDEANLARQMQESEFNRGNDQLVTNAAFQNFTNNAQRYNNILDATKYSSEYNTGLDAARAQGISGAMGNMATSLSGVGSENMWREIIDKHPSLAYDSVGNYKTPALEAAALTDGVGKHGGRILDGTETNQTTTNVPYLTKPLNIQNPLMEGVNVDLRNRSKYYDNNTLDFALNNLNTGIANYNNDRDLYIKNKDAVEHTLYDDPNFRTGMSSVTKDAIDYAKTNNVGLVDALDHIENNIENEYGDFIGNVMLSTNQLNNTDRALRAKRRAERYARRHGATDENFGNSDIENIILDPTLSIESSKLLKGPGELTLGINHLGPGTDFRKVIAHELSHRNNLYNTASTDENGVITYDANPNYIRKKHQRWLTPTEQAALDDAHDSKLNENFANLEALRLGMKDIELDGTRRYTNRDIKDYMAYLEKSGMTDTYLDQHTNINRVRKALNRVYDKGGKLLTSNKKRRK